MSDAYQDRLDFRRIDQRMTVQVNLGGQSQVGDHLGRLLQVDVGHRHHLAVEQGLAATTNVILTDGTGADDT